MSDSMTEGYIFAEEVPPVSYRNRGASPWHSLFDQLLFSAQPALVKDYGDIESAKKARISAYGVAYSNNKYSGRIGVAQRGTKIYIYTIGGNLGW